MYGERSTNPQFDPGAGADRVLDIQDKTVLELRGPLINQANGTYDWYFNINGIETFDLTIAVGGGAAGVVSVNIEFAQDGSDVAIAAANYEPIPEFGPMPKVTAAGNNENIILADPTGYARNQTKMHVELTVSGSVGDVDMSALFNGVEQ